MTTRAQSFGAALLLWAAVPLGFLFHFLMTLSLPATFRAEHASGCIWGMILLSGALGGLIAYKLSSLPVMQQTRDRMCKFGTGVAQLTVLWYMLSLPFQLAYSLTKR